MVADDISSSSDDDIINNYLASSQDPFTRNGSITGRSSISDLSRSLLMSKKTKVESEPLKVLTLTDMLKSIDNNEKKNEELAIEANDSSNILELDKEYYDLKHEMMSYTPLSTSINSRLF
jgi:hypothetical protein